MSEGPARKNGSAGRESGRRNLPGRNGGQGRPGARTMPPRAGKRLNMVWIRGDAAGETYAVVAGHPAAIDEFVDIHKFDDR